MTDPEPRAGEQSRTRPDIEGLRALAVGSVLLYHAGLAWTPGGFAGVDVFFVISGFLITGLMLREVEKHGGLRLGRFWARRARRLLPAGTVVLVFSALVTVLVLPAASRKIFGGDILAAAGYVVNWRLGAREVDYLAEDVGASPVQHFWSLAVEEQFYVVWPLLTALVVALFAARRRVVLLVVALAVTVASFAWSLHAGAETPGLSFFVSTTRAWELGVGALLAIGYPVLVRRLSRTVRAVVGWAGLGAVVVVVLGYDPGWQWPGTATLLPVLGTAALILAGGRDGTDRRGPAVVLGIAPAVWVGGLSYSLYLWHWPFLIGAEGLWGDLRVREAVVVVLASFVPAWLSYRYLENPVRHSRRFAATRPALVLGGATTVTAAATGLAVIASFQLISTVRLASEEEAPGAAALADPAYAGTDWGAVQEVRAMRPLPIRPDAPRIYENRKCIPEQLDEQYGACTYGDPEGARTVVLVGDSKAAQWFTPLDDIARRAGWRLVLMAKDGCQFADVVRPFRGEPNPSCDRWSQWALEEVTRLRPDVVVTTTRWSTAVEPGESVDQPLRREAMVDGLVTHWRAVLDGGAVLVPLLDTPGRPGSRVPECVQENLEQLSACAYPLADGLRDSGAAAQQDAAARVPQARIIDMSDVLCPDGRTCPPVIGNVLVYRSGSHLSDSYAESTAPILSARLHEATDGLLGTPGPPGPLS